MTPRRRQYSLGAGALVQPLTESGEARLRDLDILRGLREASADRPDDLAIDHDRKRTLHFGESSGRDGGVTTVVDCLLKVLARLLEERSGPRTFCSVGCAVTLCPRRATAVRATANVLGMLRGLPGGRGPLIQSARLGHRQPRGCHRPLLHFP